MPIMHSIERQRLDHGAEYLHRLGARATADFLTELAGTIGGQPAIMRLLAEYQNRAARRPRLPQLERTGVSA